MEDFLWKGRLRVIAVGEKCSMKLEDGTTGKRLFIPEIMQIIKILTYFNNYIRRIIR
jgi:hypothetical protein